MRGYSFQRIAGLCALITGVGGIAFAISFVILLRTGSEGSAIADGLLLLVSGLFTTVVFLGLYERLKAVDSGLVRCGVALGLAGSFGTTLHGGDNLASLAHPPIPACTAYCVTATNPRGLMTFGVTGVAIAVVSIVILRGTEVPRVVGQLGLLSAALLVTIYLGRLTIYNPHEHFMLVITLLEGFVVGPIWYTAIGWAL